MNGFEEALAQALLAPDDDASGALPALAGQPGFAVCRNTVLKGCVDALEANFPTVARLVGSAWFRDAGLAYARAHPPHESRLLRYGDDGFGAFVQAIPTAAGLPYLSGIAHLDTAWRASHAAADAPVLLPAALAALDAPALASRVLAPHPAARWCWYDELPVATLWLRHRPQAAPPEDLHWHGDGLLFTRAGGAVQAALLSRSGCALLDACAQGLPLGEAAARALAADPATDLGTVLAQLLAAGAFTDLAP